MRSGTVVQVQILEDDAAMCGLLPELLGLLTPICDEAASDSRPYFLLPNLYVHS